MSSTWLQRLSRQLHGDHRPRAERLRDNGFTDEVAAVAWANGVLGPDAETLGQVEQVKRLRDARPGLDLGTAVFIAKRRHARTPRG